MKPLELAKQRTAVKNCKNCADMEIINNLAYCKKSGKLIHPYLLTDEAKCPHEVKGVR